MSILELSKIVMYKFWYDYVKPKYSEKARLLYGYSQFYFIHKKHYIYNDIAEDVETRVDSANHELGRPLRK